MSRRIVIVTNGNYFARLLLDPLLDAFNRDIAGIVVVTGDYQKRSKLHALFALSGCTAWPYVAYKVVTSLVLSAAGRLDRTLALEVAQAGEKKGIPVLKQRIVNSQLVRNWVASLQPDLLVSVSCPQLIGKKMLALPRIAALNVHASLLPEYAGLAPYFWVLSQGELRTGITAHYMTERFDAGNILRQAELIVAPRESAFKLFERLAQLGGPLLCEAIEMAFDGESGVTQDMTRYSYYSHPSLKGYFALRKRGHRLLRVREILETLRVESARGARTLSTTGACRVPE